MPAAHSCDSRAVAYDAGMWLATLAVLATTAAPPPPMPAGTDTLRGLSLPRQSWTGDFDGMFEHRKLRVLIPYSRTLFFVDKGRERGLSADLARDFETFLNRKYQKKLKGRPITIAIIPTTRGKLLGDLAGGLGDIVAANLTVTDARRKSVDFITPSDLPDNDELLITGPTSPLIATLDDLSGMTLHLRPTSSYHESVVALNDRFAREGKAPVKIEPLPDALEDEDILEMLNAGALDLAVVDSWKVKLWKGVLPRIKVRQDLVLRDDGQSGWAIRHASPKLAAEITAFFKNYVNEERHVTYRLVQYEKQIKQISDNTHGKSLKRFESTLALFQKYGAKYDFDPLMLVAQGFQESRLDQSARSPAGAVGVMQLLPTTGAELKVGNIEQLEPNIHAGAKYMDQIMARYFSGAHFTEDDRTLFAFASYNAGPGRIAKLRTRAAKDGLDPNVWFDNVELEVARWVGLETTTYVRNIFKYYSAYKLTLEAEEEARKARASVPAH